MGYVHPPPRPGQTAASYRREIVEAYERVYGVRLPRRELGETEEQWVARTSAAMRAHKRTFALVAVPLVLLVFALMAMLMWRI